VIEESKSEERREEEKLPKKDARSPFSTFTFRAFADEDNVALASSIFSCCEVTNIVKE